VTALPSITLVWQQLTQIMQHEHLQESIHNCLASDNIQLNVWHCLFGNMNGTQPVNRLLNKFQRFTFKSSTLSSS